MAPAATTTKSTAGPSGPRPATFDHLQKKKPLEKTIRIFLDDETVEAHAAAVAEFEQAKLQAHSARIPDLDGTNTRLAELEEAVAKARAELDSNSVTMTFRSVGRKAYDRLVTQYPATKKQHEEHKAEHGVPAPYDADEFSVALIAASCTDPVLSEAQVRELRDTWNTTEYVEMFVAALEVNTQRRVVDLGNASG